jgi:hypothetical protein
VKRYLQQTLLALFAFYMLPFAFCLSVLAQGTVITYQGRLTISGAGANGLYDCTFQVYDAATGGHPVGPSVATNAVLVSDGLFTTALDFGTGVFTGAGRWLEFAVKSNGVAGPPTTLSPRQWLTPAPYALYTPSAGTASAAASATTAGSVPWSGLTGVPAGFADGVDNDTTYTAGAGLTLAGTLFSADFAGSGSATTVARSDHQHDANYWNLGGNSGTTPGTQFLGTADNLPVEFKVNGQRALRLEPNLNTPNVIGGSVANAVTNGLYGAVIAGGGSASSPNRVGAIYASVLGGAGNTASGNYAAAMGDHAIASGYASLGLGYHTGAGGFGSFAAGTMAKASHDGAFVWADQTFTDFASTAANQFSVRASGGVRLETGGAGLLVDGQSLGVGVDGVFGLGTSGNQPLELRVNGTRALRLEPTAGGPNLVAGFNGNWVLPGATSATIAGGGQNGSANRVTALGGTVGGGLNNAVSNWNGTVSGGANNTASGNASTVSGGSENLASGDHAVIGGGQNNMASYFYATVGGGQGNMATLDSSTVGGGWANNAGGKASTVAGGQNNAAPFSFATVGGGLGNTASNSYATVGGGSGNIVTGQYATIGGGADNIASGQYTTIGGGTANFVTNDFATVAGGFANTAVGSKSFVGGGYNNSARADYAVVGGGTYNAAVGPRSTVGGGDFNGALALRATVGGGYYNTASGTDATVAGGVYNNATDLDATVAGGSGNTASGIRSTVSGGYNNTASGYGAFVGGGGDDGNGSATSPGPNVASGPASVIGGGMFNTASEFYSTVSGGWSNAASGFCSAVGGGAFCTASGAWSFAAGLQAQATHNGSFVWADVSSANNFYSSQQNEFSVRCAGGARFYSSRTLASGVLLYPGDGSWSSASDRNLKENFRAVDTRQVLERVARLPVTEWNYKTQDSTVRHIGPMAQDFHASFGTAGDDDKHIATVDADGVALAAIQGLNQKLEEQRAENAELKARLDRLEKLIARESIQNH